MRSVRGARETSSVDGPMVRGGVAQLAKSAAATMPQMIRFIGSSEVYVTGGLHAGVEPALMRSDRENWSVLW